MTITTLTLTAAMIPAAWIGDLMAITIPPVSIATLIAREDAGVG
jgi:hypothetical protein